MKGNFRNADVDFGSAGASQMQRPNVITVTGNDARKIQIAHVIIVTLEHKTCQK